VDCPYHEIHEIKCPTNKNDLKETKHDNDIFSEFKDNCERPSEENHHVGMIS